MFIDRYRDINIPDNPAGQIADECLDVWSGVEVLALNLDPGTARLRPVPRLNVVDHRVDEPKYLKY